MSVDKQQILNIMNNEFNSSFAVKTLIDIYLSKKYKIALSMIPHRSNLYEEKIHIRRSLSTFLNELRKEGYIKKISKRRWKIIKKLENIIP
jgi:hypothetical protein